MKSIAMNLLRQRRRRGGRGPGGVSQGLPRRRAVSRRLEPLDLDLSDPRQRLLRPDAPRTAAAREPAARRDRPAPSASTRPSAAAGDRGGAAPARSRASARRFCSARSRASRTGRRARSSSVNENTSRTLLFRAKRRLQRELAAGGAFRPAEARMKADVPRSREGARRRRRPRARGRLRGARASAAPPAARELAAVAPGLGARRRSLAEVVGLSRPLAAHPPGARRGIAAGPEASRRRRRRPRLALASGRLDRRALPDRDRRPLGLPQQRRPRTADGALADDEGPAADRQGGRRGRRGREGLPRLDREALAAGRAEARRRDVARARQLPGEARRPRLRDRGAEVARSTRTAATRTCAGSCSPSTRKSSAPCRT